MRARVLTVDATLWRFVKRTTKAYAKRFRLPLRRVKPLSEKKWWYGDCSMDGVVRIQFRFQASRRRCYRLHAYQILDTMAHELAHLRHINHGPRWFELHVRILCAMMKAGEYKRLRKLVRDVS